MESGNFTVVVDTHRSTRTSVTETKFCAIGSLVIGILCIILGFLLYGIMEEDNEVARIGFSVWTGLFIVVTAALGLCAVKWRNNTGLNIAYLVLNVITMILVGVCIVAYISSVVLFARYRDDEPCHDTILVPYHHWDDAVMPPRRNMSTTAPKVNMTTPEPQVLPSCLGPPHNWKSALVIFILLTTVMITELVIVIISIVLSCRAAGCCSCCQSSEVAYKRHIDGRFTSGENTKQMPGGSHVARSDWSNPTLMVPPNEAIPEIHPEKKPLGDP